MMQKTVAWLLFVVCLLPVQITIAANGADAQYDLALDQIERNRFSQALATLRQLQRQHPRFKQMSAVQTRIAVLQESADAGASLPVFLRALNLRDEGRMVEALASLNVIATNYPAGPLTDDALYIIAYLQVMDRYDFVAARVALQTLNDRFPESAYTDSAQYLDAIALEQMGDTELARLTLIALRERHTALSLPLSFRWPKGTVLSRYWFDRADRRLAIVEQRIASGSRLKARRIQSDGKLRVAVTVNGADMQLLLEPSPLTSQTSWRDSGLSEVLPPAIGVFEGSVEGINNSWVRVLVQDNAITGVVSINGQQTHLQPANLMGTLDYYQPRSRKPVSEGGFHSDLADNVQGLDVMIAPPERIDDAWRRRSNDFHSSMRAVPVSIVVDSQYDRYYAGQGMANALNSLNIADGIYRQFGLALILDEALVFDEGSDPLRMGRVPLESILRGFRDYRNDFENLFDNSALSYLFTGNPKSDITLGLAWIGTACRSDGYDVGVTTPSSFGEILLTHELGHSLGAAHDSDTACNDNALSLMWPNISERTQPRFTQCSADSVRSSRAKSCLRNSVDLRLSANSTGTQVSFTVTNPDLAMVLDAQLMIETSAPDQLQWLNGCQVQTPTSALCQVNALGPQERRSLSMVINTPFQGADAPVTGQLVPVGLLELQPADNLATASLAGGSSSQHLNVTSPGVDLTTTPHGQNASHPATGAAASAATLGWVSLLVVLSMLLCRRCCSWWRYCSAAGNAAGRVPKRTL